MIDRNAEKVRRAAGISPYGDRPIARNLRAAVIIIPFAATVVISFIYGSWRFPPASFQSLILTSTLLCLVIISRCRTWMYRFQAGAPLLAVSFGGALFFPMAASLHIWEYHLVDSCIGLGVALSAWATSTYAMWRLFQPSQDPLWNTFIEGFRQNPNHWLVIVIVPLIWAGYGFSLFAFLDTQFDWSKGRLLHPTVVSKSKRLGGSGLHYYAALSPWPREYNASAGHEGPEIPAAIYNRLEVGGPACVVQHPGFLRARWYGVEACFPPREARATLAYAPTLAAS